MSEIPEKWPPEHFRVNEELALRYIWDDRDGCWVRQSDEDEVALAQKTVY